MPPKPPPPAQKQQSEPAPSSGEGGMTIGQPKVEWQPPRIVINAVEGFGKTTIGAQAPDPVILQIQGETGYSTLRSTGLVPEVKTPLREDGSPATIDSWQQLLNTLDQLADTKHKTLVLDAAGGLEALCHEHVCQRDFNGDWSERGFEGFQRGYKTAMNDWRIMLSRLDKIREKQGAMILILSHAQVQGHKNPTGPDFDRYVPDLHTKTTWAATARWADVVLFGNFVPVVDTDRANQKKGKGIGGDDRMLYCTRSDAWDAKNRYGLPDQIELPKDHNQNWPTIWQYLQPAS